MGELKKPLRPAEIIGGLLVAVAVIWWMASGSDDAKPSHAVAPPTTSNSSNPVQILPETVIRFNQGTYACLNPDDVRKMIEYAMKGEKTKANAMDVSSGGGCAFIAPEMKVRVISTQYQNSHADMGLLEVVGEKNQSGKGAWALSIGAVPVK